MLRRALLWILLLVLALPFDLTAQKGGSHASSSRSSPRRSSSKSSTQKAAKPAKTKAPKSSLSTKSTVAARDSHDRIKRSAAARDEFMKQTGYPKGRRGYVVDHIV